MTLEEIKAAVAAAKEDIWMNAAAAGRRPKIYMHWTGGYYETDFPEYHFSINGAGEISFTHGFDSKLAATYMRNSGSVAIALNCCVNAVAYADGTCKLGECPPTPIQIEAMAQVVAVVVDALGVPIDIYHVMTHAEAADNMDGLYPCDPYGPATTCERWDLAVLSEDDGWMSGGDTLRGKAIFYQEQGV